MGIKIINNTYCTVISTLQAVLNLETFNTIFEVEKNRSFEYPDKCIIYYFTKFVYDYRRYEPLYNIIGIDFSSETDPQNSCLSLK